MSEREIRSRTIDAEDAREGVRLLFCHTPEADEIFDHWRDAEIRKAKAEALREAARVVSSQAAEEWRKDRGEGTPGGISIICAPMIAQSLDMVAKIINNRAEQIEEAGA